MMSLIDLDYDLEAERRARLAHRRRLWLAKMLWHVVWAVMILVFVVSLASIVWSVINLERFERASYNEGRFGVDRATALAMSDAGIGKCAEDFNTVKH